MRTENLKREPPPQRNMQFNSNILILGIVIFALFGCFAVAGPLGLFTKLSDFFADLNPKPVTAYVEGTPILLGIYTSESLQVTSWEIENFDEWMHENGLDKGISIAGTYMDFEFHNPEFNVDKELGAAWDLGYTPFVNLTAYQRTAEQVAWDPEFEQRVRAWASAFAEWSNGGEKRAFIAPLQEMNGGWVRYGLDPVNFKVAWHKIRRIFAEEGVAENAVSWVFAPNAWSEEGHEFEVYYPGDAVVDVVAFSTMNFGGCVDYGSGWDTFENIYKPYLERMREMAPGKPIFLAQTASVGVGPDGKKDDRLKNEWLRDTIGKLAAFPNVKGIIYYNVLKAEPTIDICRPVDWRVFDKHSGTAYKGYLDAVRNPQFVYWAPDSDEMLEIGFGRKEGRNYADIWPSTPLSGVEDVWYYQWVETLADAGLAIGCRMETYQFNGVKTELEFFCPKNPITRAEAAVFLELALHGKGYWPPAPVGVFDDVPVGYWAAGWIEQLVADGLSSGCGERQFCPESIVSRAQLAVMVGKAIYTEDETFPNQPTGSTFVDVESEDWAANYIEQLAREGIISGCKVGKYCPDEAVMRAELAAMIVKAFAIPPMEGTDWILPDL
jgi:hypothetical protein